MVVGAAVIPPWYKTDDGRMSPAISGLAIMSGEFGREDSNREQLQTGPQNHATLSDFRGQVERIESKPEYKLTQMPSGVSHNLWTVPHE